MNTRPVPPLPVPALREVAETSAHSLNNALGTLFAADSHLESTEPSAAVARSREALEQACASVRAVSEALLLLALSPSDLATLSGSPPAVASHADLLRLAGGLLEVAGVDLRVDEHLALPRWADRDILGAALICYATTVRRAARHRGSIPAVLEAEGADASGQRWLMFRLETSAGTDPDRLATAARQHPAGHALAHLSYLLADAGIDIAMSAGTDGSTALRLGMSAS